MAYFPQSLMPARVKSEASDVDGNRYIVDGSDHNRVDEEIRAIEKMLAGVQTGGGGTAGTVTNCSVLDVLISIAAQLQLIRDTQVDSTSGVVAVKDAAVVPVPDGLIPFPPAWYTTLASDIPDATVQDETPLPALAEITVGDVTGFPDEGYATIINDVSLGNSIVVNSATLTIYSSAIAHGKVGADFLYEIIATDAAATFTATGLPAGLSLSGNLITGVPTTAGTSTVSIGATSGSQTTGLQLVVTIYAADTPAILGPDNLPTGVLSAVTTAGSLFKYTVKYTGSVTIVITGLPAGLTYYGNVITGTPREPQVYSIDITITDDSGTSATAVLTLTVGA